VKTVHRKLDRLAAEELARELMRAMAERRIAEDGTAEPETRIISAEATRTAGLVCDGRAVSRRSAQ
jgi:hypothetical protein